MYFWTVSVVPIVLALISLVAGDALQHWTDVASRSRSNVITLNDQTFDQLITPERNYTTIGTLRPKLELRWWSVCLTALPAQFQCGLCREFRPAFHAVAQSWRKAHPQSDGVFFAELDFPDGRPIFVRVLLIRLNTANASLVSSLHRMYGYILLLLALSQNCLPTINPSSTIFLESILAHLGMDWL